eukprot:TRINITY_DN60847_c0_g1_i1.p1 TRINITY_DN60847_c0_g1~~TRINITY_DN60847_c0_g1_i1.p1  ORF type:complete len:851 (-),score=103.83 TRINITY_DN60847_c0_g1_i1:443-2995(-)
MERFRFVSRRFRFFEFRGSSSISSWEVLGGHASAGNVDAALVAFRNTNTADTRLSKPSAWNTVLKAYANAGDTLGAVGCYRHMLRNGVRVNTNSLGKLIEAAAKAGLVVEAEKWFNIAVGTASDLLRIDSGHAFDRGHSELLTRALPTSPEAVSTPAPPKSPATTGPPCVMYETIMIWVSTVIDACAKGDDPERAVAWLFRMDFIGTQIEIQGLGAIVDAFARLGRTDEVRLWLDEIARRKGQPPRKYSDISFTKGATAVSMSVDSEGLGDATAAASQSRGDSTTSDCLVRLRNHNYLLYSRVAPGNLKPNEVAAELDSMEQASLVPDMNSYLCLIDACARHSDAVGAGDALEGTKRAGLQPTRAMYTMVINACAKAADASQAARWLQDMSFARLDPCVLAYAAVIDAFSKAGDPDGGELYLDKLEVARVRPDAACFNAAASGFARRGDSQGVARCLRRMERSGVAFDAISFNVAIDSFSKRGDVRETEAWLKKMENACFTPDILSYTAVIGVNARRGKTRQAAFWLAQMAERTIQADLVCLNTVIDCHVKSGNMDEAVRWLLRAEPVLGLLPDDFTYNSIMGGFARSGRLDVAAMWLERMISADVRPTVVTFNTLIAGAARAGRPEEAERWLVRMRADRLEADVVSFNAVMHGWSEVGDSAMTMKWFDHIYRACLSPCIVSFTTAMRSHARNGHVSPAKRLLGDMKAKAVQADIMAYNTLLLAHAKAMDADGAQELLSSLPSLSLVPNIVSWNLTIAACAVPRPRKAVESSTAVSSVTSTSQQRRCEDAERLLANMINACIVPNAATARALDRTVGRARKEILLRAIPQLAASVGDRPRRPSPRRQRGG